MPPKTRAKKLTKLKENSGVVLKTKNVESKVKKPIRKPLADKTNSASDNTSTEAPLKLAQKVAASKKKSKPTNEVRPRRDRRLPTRFVENQVLINLSNSKDNCDIESPKPTETKLSKTKDLSGDSTFKSAPTKDSSLVVSRPKRVSRLPSRFENHSISPNKFVPVQPCHSSTPIVQTRTKPQPVKGKLAENQSLLKRDKSIQLVKNVKKRQANKKPVSKTLNSLPDSNNNAKRTRSVVNKQNKVVDKSETESPKGKKRNLNISNNSSLFKFLGEKPNIRKSNRKQDVYEFTFDPDEEPTPQKKKSNPKKKKTTVKKTKTVVYKNNYDKNVAKALADLKNKVLRKPETQSTQNVVHAKSPGTDKQINVEINDVPNANIKPSSSGMSIKPVHVDNYASIRIEDIAADFDASINHDDHPIDYSPVNSPSRPKSPELNPVTENSVQRALARSNDPLNLQENVSFFDEQPVASSSMNVSVRHPLASPWRVEFNNLPIKWQANTYMKANMTPALDSSFINSDESRNKHVYTNLVPQTNDSLDIIQNDTPKLKQTSIISFIREVAERSANKKKKINSKTQNWSLIHSDVNIDQNNQENVSNNSNASGQNVSDTNKSGNQSNENISDNIENLSKESASKESRKRKNDNVDSPLPAKSPKRATLFGFDDSENVDQENVSPSKQAIGRKRLMRATRSRAVLQELNEPAGPMRALVPLAAKIKFDTNSEVVNKLYNELKVAEAPVVPEMMPEKNNASNVQETTWQEDSMSVHLFEDVEMVVKPPRKSYGKAKKVAFRQASSNSDIPDGARAAPAESSDEDLSDLTFHIPSEKAKKPAKKKETKKKKLNKKEQEEVEAWAAGFNSMCEDVEEFDLVVE